MSHIYLGTSYYFNGDNFRDMREVCIGDTIHDVTIFMRDVRGYPIINPEDPSTEAMEFIMDLYRQNGLVSIGAISRLSFPTDEYKYSYLQDPRRQNLILEEHLGGIDHHIMNIRKSDAKELMVPNIVERIILAEEKLFRAEAEVTANTLKKLLLFIHGTKKDHDLGRSIFATTELLRAITRDEIDMFSDICERHPILYCGEAEYRATIERQLMLDDMTQRYESMV